MSRKRKRKDVQGFMCGQFSVLRVWKCSPAFSVMSPLLLGDRELEVWPLFLPLESICVVDVFIETEFLKGDLCFSCLCAIFIKNVVVLLIHICKCVQCFRHCSSDSQLEFIIFPQISATM